MTLMSEPLLFFVMRTAAVVVLAGAAAVAIGGSLWAYFRIQSLNKEVERVLKLRKEERQGRKRAEKRLEEVALEPQDSLGGFLSRRIGVLRTPFPTLQGTPRQGVLVPSSRGVIKIDDVLGSDGLDGLEAFSHVWLLYVFHKNTNFFKHERAHREALAVATTQGSAVRHKQPKFRFTAKIAPPALKGKKIGVLATRSPHHPNALGIIAVKLEKVDLARKEVHVSGLDCVDRTPILDIKPYLPYSDSFPQATVPEWVSQNQPLAVTFAAGVVDALSTLVEDGVTRMYSDASSALQAVTEAVSVNIKAKQYGRPRQLLFDGLAITYSTQPDTGTQLVLRVEAYSPDDVTLEQAGDSE